MPLPAARLLDSKSCWCVCSVTHRMTGEKCVKAKMMCVASWRIMLNPSVQIPCKPCHTLAGSGESPKSISVTAAAAAEAQQGLRKDVDRHFQQHQHLRSRKGVDSIEDVTELKE